VIVKLRFFDIDCMVVILGIFRFIILTIYMNQTINEPIRVAGVFERSCFKPIWFDWNNKRLKISKVTFTTDYKQGLVKHKTYSVIAEDNLYRLHFNLISLDWILKSVWLDG